mgnify:CR=1 FL=1
MRKVVVAYTGTRVVYMGIDTPKSTGHSAYMASYNLTVGKEYDMFASVGGGKDGVDIFIREDNMKFGGTYIGKEYIDLYFKPLSEVRNDKIDELLNL